MAMPSNRVGFPTPPADSFNALRPLNESLRHQVAYFHAIERFLAVELQTGIDISAIRTEGEASSYIGKLTLTLYSEGVREKELRYQELIERKYLDGLTPADKTALETLTKDLSMIDEGFYRPLIDSLKEITSKTTPSKH